MIQITDLSHVSLIVSDMDASARFYGEVLGLEEVARPATFKFNGKWFRRASAEIHLIHASESTQQPGDGSAQPTERSPIARTRHLAFAVQDADETLEALAWHGVEVVQGPQSRGDGATQIYCFDPDGHLVELHTPPSR